MRQNRTASQKKRKWPWILGVAVVAVLIAFAAIRGRNANAATTGGIRAVKAEKGTLSITVVGTGNLEYDDAEDIEVPTGVTVDEVLVESGDAVRAGDVLATFDALSLKREIESVRKSIESLDRRIQSAKKSAETQSVKANVEGRVKAVYAQKGDDALEVYYEHGALMVLSIDGKMAVDFNSGTALFAGDKITVLLESGKAVEGTVERAEGGTVTVTLTDNGPKLDEPVTVQTKDGQNLGSGRLYIHQPIRIVATDGKVKTVHVSENDKVSAGKTVVTLEDLSTSLEYEQLLADRDDYLEKLDSLLEIAKTNALTAKFDGVIQTVSLKDGKSTGAAASVAAPSAGAASAYGGAPASGGASTYGGMSPSGASGASPSAANASAYGGAAAASAPSMQGANAQSPAAQVSPSTSSASVSGDHMAVGFTVSPSNSVVLTVKVDELDILSIHTGMGAEVSFDAIPDRTFTGEIIEISDAAAATGGVAKFTAKVRIPRDDAMRIGMNATATILVERKENILLLPIAALQESGGRVYVYTHMDEKTGELSGEVDVATGSSDGEFVEITKGLSDGDEVFYKVASGDLMTQFGPGRFFRNGANDGE